MARKQFSSGWLIRRSLTPSASSGFICITLGFVITIVHIILLSVSVGTALPGLLDGQWAVSYTENVVQPLATFFTNGALNKLLVAGLWGGIGLAVYMGFEYAIHTYQTMQEAKRQVTLNTSGAWDAQAMSRSFLQSMLWRVGVIILAGVFLMAMGPLFRYALEVVPQIIVSRDLARDGLRAVGAAMVWALFFHGCVVLLRLYTTRTRIFGDDKLY